MRLVHVYVPDDRRSKVERTLEEIEIDYAVVADDADRMNLFQFPLPQGAMGEVLEGLREIDVEEDAYVVITGAETAMTENIGDLRDRYADSYSPLPAFELQAKARSLNYETTPFLWMVFLSAVVATVGLLIDSPAVVVGSMVLAPLVGPTLTASVGAVTGHGEMFLGSVRQQLRGLVVAVVGAVVTALAIRYSGLIPATLDPTSLELVAVRLSPGALSVLVGFAAGAAATFGLTTEGPLSIIGVMIAAALIPAAGVTGIGVAYGSPLLALGTVVLLVVSLLAINVGEVLTLFLLGYRDLPSVVGDDDRDGDGAAVSTKAAAIAVVVLLVAGPAVVGTGQQIALQREVTDAVDDVLSEQAYRNVSVVGITVEYSYPIGFSATPVVTVGLSTTANASAYPDIADEIRSEIYERTGRRPTVRVTFTEYQRARGNVAGQFDLHTPRPGGIPG